MKTKLRDDLGFCRLISGIVGGFLGIVVSVVVNCTLVEISINAFFSVYFGILFIVVGGVILWRVYTATDAQYTDSKRQYLIGFAAIVMASGLVCFILEKN